MIQNFVFSINSVLPIFIIMMYGFIIARLGFLEPVMVKKVNKLVFTFALPVMLFRDIANSRFGDIFDISLVIFAIATTLAAFALSWLFAALVLPDKKSIGAFVQGSFRSNYAIIGLPLIANILGDKNTGKGALITTFIIPLYSILSVIILSISNPDTRKGKGLFLNTLSGIYKNPLIIGILLGLPFSYFNIRFPVFISSGINSISSMTTPLALLAIGASIEISEVRGKLKWGLTASLFKLVVMPLIFIPLALRFNITGESLVVLLVMYSSPTAVSSYVMADSMGNDSTLAASIIVLTTLLSVLTFTVGVFILKSMGLVI